MHTGWRQSQNSNTSELCPVRLLVRPRSWRNSEKKEWRECCKILLLLSETKYLPRCSMLVVYHRFILNRSSFSLFPLCVSNFTLVAHVIDVTNQMHVCFYTKILHVEMVKDGSWKSPHDISVVIVDISLPQHAGPVWCWSPYQGPWSALPRAWGSPSSCQGEDRTRVGSLFNNLSPRWKL